MEGQMINWPKTGVVLLAGGSSSRLGRPKQLLLHEGKTLLQHSLEAAFACGAQPVVVVLGANSGVIEKELSGNEAVVVVNPEWQEGMGSSIRCGTKTLMEKSPDTEAVIVMVCDQPFVSAALLNDLLFAHQKTGKPIVACSYANTFGPPVFFHRSLFSTLLQLKGDVGARNIIRTHTNDVATIVFPQGKVDIDTEEDFQNLNGMQMQ